MSPGQPKEQGCGAIGARAVLRDKASTWGFLCFVVKRRVIGFKLQYELAGRRSFVVVEAFVRWFRLLFAMSHLKKGRDGKVSDLAAKLSWKDTYTGVAEPINDHGLRGA
jgi:hypothetical protein